MGKKSGKRNCIPCRRCGKTSYHKIKSICASCGFGKTAKIKKFAWQSKR